jgi:hypothetical protein
MVTTPSSNPQATAKIDWRLGAQMFDLRLQFGEGDEAARGRDRRIGECQRVP